MSKIDSIIFDLDGTLWSSAKAISEAWGLVLQKHENIEKKEVTEEELYSCMGLPMYDIAAKLFPSLAENIRNQLMDELCEFENGYLEKRGGVLYDGLEETLAQLQKKYKLYIVSNCQDGYIEAFIKAHHMEKYFEDTECWGRTRLSKGESNKILIARNHLQNPVYVGDTAGDYQSAIDARIPFIYAAYGFGEVRDCDYKIQSIRELPEVVEQVNENKK
jgi:phosphoglycolate phosphatase